MIKSGNIIFKKSSLSLFFFLIIFISSCSHFNLWRTRIEWEELQFADIPEQTDYPEADAVILFDRGDMYFKKGDLQQSIFEKHKAIKIFNKPGYRYANIVIPYGSSSQIGHIKARTISPDGKIRVLEKDKIFDVNLYPDFVFYSDQRGKKFTMPAVEEGAIIEWEYQQNTWDLNYSSQWNFQDKIPTLFSRFNLRPPSNWEVNYKIYNIDIEPEINKAPEGFDASYTWEARNVAAIKSEFAAPPIQKMTGRLEIAPLGFSCWDDIAQWYHSLANPQIKANKGVRELTDSLTGNLSEDWEKLKKIYQWVRDNIRYIAIDVGSGSFQPRPAEEVLKNRYGDCKDMTALLCSMGKEADIQIHATLTSTKQNGRPDTSLASPLHFNHVIAYCPEIGDNGMWLDATAKTCPFGEIPWFDQNLPVFCINENGKGNHLTTPRNLPVKNLTEFVWDLEFDSSGSVEISGYSQYSGVSATETRESLYLANFEDIEQWLQLDLANRFSGIVLDSFQVIDLGVYDNPLRINFLCTSQAFPEIVKNQFIINAGQILNFQLASFFRTPDRIFPVEFRYGIKKSMSLNIHLPEKWSVQNQSFTDTLQTRFGSAFREYSSERKLFHIHYEYTMNDDDIPVEQYSDFQQFLDDLERKFFTPIIVWRD